jgi:NADH:ubiquinone oxidoreductase subunit F (NADH-binding)
MITRAELSKIKEEVLAKRKKATVTVCNSTGGIAAGSRETYQVLRTEAAKRGLTVDFEAKRCGCLGKCAEDPLLTVAVEGMPTVTYARMTPDRVPALLDRHIVGRQVIPEFVLEKHEAKQLKIVLRNCGLVDPENIKDYIAQDGYQSAAKVLLEMKPEEVIEEMIASGLRGRGGAGFPTGLKWRMTRATPSDQRYIICNGDEGDPGAFMDRGVLESDPHSVLEGMIIGAYAMGASVGYFYIRAEYPLAVERIERAIKQAYANRAFSGKNILGTHFSLDAGNPARRRRLRLRRGDRAHRLHRGQARHPDPRPPYPSVQRPLGQAHLHQQRRNPGQRAPPFHQKGGAWFASIGIGKSKGTKVFAVTGKVRQRPAGRGAHGHDPPRDRLRHLRRTVLDGKKVKAVQTGGPSAA